MVCVFFIAPPAELEEELSVARKRAQRRDALCNGGRKKDEAESEFEQTLTTTEIENYNCYKQRRPSCCYMLGQSATEHAQHSTQTVLNTIIKNSGCVMSSIHRRWMTPRELIVAQGFPCYDELLPGASACTRLNTDRERRRNNIIEHAGNAMHVNMIGSAMTYALGCVHRLDIAARL